MKSEKTKKLLHNEKVEDKPAIILQSDTDYVSLIEPCLADLWNFKVLSYRRGISKFQTQNRWSPVSYFQTRKSLPLWIQTKSMCIKLSWYYETLRVAKIRPSEVNGLNHPLEFSSKIATENL